MAKPALTVSDLRTGSALALEHAGHLLADALLLYERQRYPSAATLAVFSREETGRSQILAGLARSVFAGQHFTRLDVQRACKHHEVKLQKSFSGVTLRIQPELGTVLAQVLGNPRHPKYADYRRLINEKVKAAGRNLPKRTHEARIRALYVDPAENGGWNRPADLTREEAFAVVSQAADDYAIRRDELYLDPDTIADLSSWLEKHPLPKPDFPSP